MLVKLGKDIERDVDNSRLNDATRDYIMYMGWRNVLMDSHASHTRESGDDYLVRSNEAVDRKLASIYAGEVRAVGTRTTDPVARQMRALSEARVHEALREHCRKTGKKMGSFTSEQITAAINKDLAKNEASLRKTAEKMVRDAAAAKVETVELDI